MKIRLHLIYIIFLFFFISCSTQKDNNLDLDTTHKVINENKNHNINEFILKQFDTHDVILLGENKHHERIYYQNLIEFLNCWIDKIESDRFAYHKIGLILENSHLFREKLYSFFVNDDISQLIYHPIIALNSTVADLEFWYNLKSIRYRIDEINKNRPSNSRIEFEILCPEKDIPHNWSKEESDKYFKTERDIYTENFISEHIKTLPGFKFVGSFGLAHIFKKKFNKNDRPILVEQLLKKGIKTFSINRSLMKENKYQMTFSDDEKDFVLPLSVFEGAKYYLNDDYLDAWIFYNGSYFNDIRIENIPSVNIIKNYIDFSKNFSSKYLIPLRWTVWYRLSGEKVPPGEDLIQHIQSRIMTFNTINIIDDFSFIKNTINSFENSRLPDSEIDRIMINITGCLEPEYKENILNGKSSSIEFWKKYVTCNKKRIKVRLLTALLFYGTKEEKSRALNKLKNITNMDFSEPQEWIKWYREQNVND